MTEPKSRIVYFGTPQVAVAPLRALYDVGHEVVLVVTRPPRRRGRREAPTPSPVAAAAAELGLDVTWDSGPALDADADLGVVVAYGELIVDEVLLRRRTVNLHFSLLPRWRGAAPVERAMLAGDTETGCRLMEVVSELDAGGMYRRAWRRSPLIPQQIGFAPSCASSASRCCWRPWPRASESPSRSRARLLGPTRSPPRSCASTGRPPLTK